MASLARQVLDDVVAHINAAASKEQKPAVNFVASRTDRHRGFFVFRRAEDIHDSTFPQNAALSRAALTSRILKELAAVEGYLAGKLKTILPGAPAQSPPYLDLHDLAFPRTSTKASEARIRERDFRRDREYRIKAIAWRAAGIHNALWSPSPDGSDAELDTRALDEFVNRRLRIVERMNYQIGRAESLINGASWNFTFTDKSTPEGPWSDGFRVRMFEYPRIPTAGKKAVVKFLGGDTKIANEANERFLPTDPAWQWEEGRTRLLWNRSLTRPGPHMEARWSPDPSEKYSLNFTSTTVTPSAAIDALFQMETDWWKRSWLFCDHVVSALHLDALLFGLRRRDPTTPTAEQEFNTLVRTSTTGYLAISSFLMESFNGQFVRRRGSLMGMGTTNDPYFDNTVTGERDLQIGDHVIFYNSHVFRLISPSEWSLENTIILDADSDPTTGGVRRPYFRLQGHGTNERTYAKYLSQDIATPFNDVLTQVRTFIATAVHNNANVTSLDWNGYPGLLTRWEPYQSVQGPGAWWIRVERALTPFDTMPEVKAAVLGAVDGDPSPTAGYTPPPSTTAVFFPLYRPVGFANWLDYFASRHSTKHAPKPPKLAAFKATGDMMPGFFVRGETQSIPVLRPK